MYPGIGRNVMAPQYEDDYRKGRRNETHANEIKDRQMIRRELRLEKLVRLSSAPGERNIEVAKVTVNAITTFKCVMEHIYVEYTCLIIIHI